MTSLTSILDARVRSAPSTPLLTHYSSPVARAELSARTFANWVDKTANLLADELEPGERVRLTLLADHPAHWMTAVWVFACWRAGMTVTDGEAELTVTGPQADGGPGSYACSLHPLGLGLRGLPEGVRDFSAEALAQPDIWMGGPAEETAVAWDVAGVRLTQTELAVRCAAPTEDRQVITDAGDPLGLLTDTLVPALAHGSVLVLDPSLSADERATIESSER